MKNSEITKLDRFLLMAKNHKLLSIVIFVAVITVGVGAFTDAIDKVWIFTEKRVIRTYSADTMGTKENQKQTTQIVSAKNQYTVIPGIGLPNCRIGDPKQSLINTFGVPSSDDGKFVSFRNHGVQARIESGKIIALFFYYRNNRFASFPGATPEGVSYLSKPSDIIKIYGDVSRIYQSTVFAASEESGAVEFDIPYDHLGINFTFYNDELYDIRVISPIPIGEIQKKYRERIDKIEEGIDEIFKERKTHFGKH